MPAAAIRNALASNESVRRYCVEPARFAGETSRRGVRIKNRLLSAGPTGLNPMPAPRLRHLLCQMNVSVKRFGNVFAHQGLQLDAEIGSYQNRHRQYAPKHKRFVQRDPGATARSSIVNRADTMSLSFQCRSGQCGGPPIRAGVQGRVIAGDGYQDGLNSYAYVAGCPQRLRDPYGTDACDDNLPVCLDMCDLGGAVCLGLYSRGCLPLCRYTHPPLEDIRAFCNCLVMCNLIGALICDLLETGCELQCQDCHITCVLSRDPGEIQPDGTIQGDGPGTWPDDECPVP